MSDLQSTTQEIIKLHENIIQAARRSVHDAIRIGQLLTFHKERLEYGDYLKWCADLPFSNDTGERYRRLFKHSDKIRTVRNLSEAYKQIETIESQQKKENEERVNRLIFERKQTGQKPESWDRSCDYQWKKAHDDAEFEKRREKVLSEKQAERVQTAQADDTFQRIRDRIEREIEIDENVEEKKKALRLNSREDQVNQEIMFETIHDYIMSGDNVHRQIEMGQNIIKYVRDLLANLQSQSVKAG